MFDSTRKPRSSPSRPPARSEEAAPAPLNETWLKLSMASDPAEREADRLADAALHESGTPRAPSPAPSAGDEGAELDPATRGRFERAFGADLAAVRIHAGERAARAAEAFGARAFTTGHGIVFGRGAYAPGTPPGDRLLAHELAHVVQGQTGRAEPGVVHRQQAPPSLASARPMSTPSEFGQADASADRVLICDLSSPLVVGSQPRYEVVERTYPSDAYIWTVTDRGNGSQVFLQRTTTPVLRITATRAGSFDVTVEAYVNRAPAWGMPVPGANRVGRLTLRQDVVAEDPYLTEFAARRDADSAAVSRELINDFRGYIVSAAAATGPTGITERFLAGVLLAEIAQRPKAGREQELAGVDADLRTLEGGGSLAPWSSTNRSLGVGQVRMSTAAMVTGATPWVEQDRADRAPGRRQAEQNYDALTPAQKRQLFDLLRFPKSNIRVVAELLTRLKNRPNRWPALDATAFGGNARAVGVVATEHNQGATNSPAADAEPSDYGRNVWAMMNSEFLMHYFRNTR
jgi:hypothetical protein